MSIQPSPLRRIHGFLSRCSAGQIALICLALQATIAILDATSGPDVIAMPFYCVPIAIAAWYVGVALGAFNAVLSTAISLGIQLSGPGSGGAANPYQVAADAIVAISTFVLTALVTSRVHASISRAAQRRRSNRRPRSISSGEFAYVTLDELTEAASPSASIGAGSAKDLS